MDIHNYRHRVDKLISNIKDSNLSKSNKKLLKQFHDNCFTEGLSFCRTERYLYDAFRLAKSMKKGLLKVTKDELKSFVAEIENSELSPNTKHSYKVSIRKFYKSIEGPEEKGVYPERVKWLHSNVKRNQVKSPEELLTDEDIRKMLSCSFNPRE